MPEEMCRKRLKGWKADRQRRKRKPNFSNRFLIAFFLVHRIELPPVCQSISWHRTINEAATYYKIWKALGSQSIAIVLSEKAPGDHVYVNTTKEAEHCPFEQEKEKNKENCS